MLACAESNFSNFKFEYLCENEFLRKTILACLSGAQMGSIHEKKNRGRKSRDTALLTPGGAKPYRLLLKFETSADNFCSRHCTMHMRIYVLDGFEGLDIFL